jgi:dihydrolipoamide dehydrogenase
VTVRYQDKDGENEESVERLIVAVGRRPNTDGLFAAETGLLLDEWGFVHVDEHCRTNLPNIYAVGDVVRGPMLAHKGMEEGVMVAERIAGHSATVNYDLIPSVIYTQPEIAWVGKAEQMLKSAGEPYRAGVFPFAANGRAKAMARHPDSSRSWPTRTDRVRGVHDRTGVLELIAAAGLAMSFGAIQRGHHAHDVRPPDAFRSLHESALAVAGRAIHLAQPRHSKT